LRPIDVITPMTAGLIDKIITVMYKRLKRLRTKSLSSPWALHYFDLSKGEPLWCRAVFHIAPKMEAQLISKETVAHMVACLGLAAGRQQLRRWTLLT